MSPLEEIEKIQKSNPSLLSEPFTSEDCYKFFDAVKKCELLSEVNPNSVITTTYSSEPPNDDCIVTWIDQQTGEQFKRIVKQQDAFMIMAKLKLQGETNIAAMLIEDDFITKEDLRLIFKREI